MSRSREKKGAAWKLESWGIFAMFSLDISLGDFLSVPENKPESQGHQLEEAPAVSTAPRPQVDAPGRPVVAPFPATDAVAAPFLLRCRFVNLVR